MHVKHLGKQDVDMEHAQFLMKVDDLHPDDPTEHHVSFSEVAIADRMVVYGLGTTEEAIEALLHEHDVRLNGRTKKRTVRWHEDVDVAKVLKPYMPKIHAMVRQFKDEVQ